MVLSLSLNSNDDSSLLSSCCLWQQKGTSQTNKTNNEQLLEKERKRTYEVDEMLKASSQAFLQISFPF